MVRVGIVGAGPAGLAAADYLSNFDSIEVEMFESGRQSRARVCPVDLGMGCSGCAGLCNVISGIGGCIQPGDSIKLSMFPSGRRLAKHIGRKNRIFAQKKAMEFFGVRDSSFHEGETTKFGALYLRSYPIHELSPKDVLHLHAKFLEICKRLSKLYVRSKITNIEFTPSGIGLRSGNGGSVSGAYDHVIIASGRSGYNSLIENSSSVFLTAQKPNLSIGVRLELPAEMLVSMFNVHRDFKFSKTYGPHKVKSFCFSSAGLLGGRLKFCHYPDQFTYPVTLLDGHANYGDDQEVTHTGCKYGNIGLLIQMPDSIDANWLNQSFLRKYHELSKGRPIAQSLSSWIAQRDEPFPPEVSVSDVQNGGLDTLFSQSQRSAFVSAIMDVMIGIEECSRFTVSELINAANLIGPEVEFFWPTVDVSTHMQTEIPGLFVAGDALGIAQGNFQAAVSGIMAARGIAIQESQHIPKQVIAADNLARSVWVHG